MKVKQDKESEELRGMRESIEEMEQDLKGMEQDLKEATKIPDSEMREVALKNLTKMRDSTHEMIASFKETYKVMLESEARLYDLRQ